jgi:hypothetical protein
MERGLAGELIFLFLVGKPVFAFLMGKIGLEDFLLGVIGSLL